MYSILLVDDEAIELETIEHYVPWDRIGIAVAGTARNGKEALALLAELKPDIVLTDVRMPIMDGLEFGRRAKQIDRSVKIIYLSGHNEFQYIKAALNIEAAGYLLKPIDMEELTALIEKVKKKCEEDQLADRSGDWLREKLMMRVIRETNAEKRLEWIRKLELSAPDFAPNWAFAAACVTFDAPPAAGGGSGQPALDDEADRIETVRRLAERLPGPSIVVETAPDAALIVYQWNDDRESLVWTADYWELLLQEAGDAAAAHMTVGLSAPRRGFRQLWDAYAEAAACNEEKLYRVGGSVIAPDQVLPAVQRDVDAEQPAARLAAAIQSGDADEARRLLGEWFSAIREERIERNFAVRAVIRLLTALEQQFPAFLAGSLKEMLHVDHWKEVSSMKTLAHMHAYVAHFCGELLRAAGERDVDRNQAVAEQIVRLIQERHHLPLTVEDIAKEVYLSPNYIRTIFKEKTGETILDYLTKFRMNRAAELLKDKSLKVREIAHNVGYENVSYFCSVFHKHRGSTPNEYRKMYL
ncbi:response regulator [Paenibacillus arenilitoris]|uniref:Response regulator n=1 Tax=Paenibacillus arenilitoris TaxID=2772299 RepID=A0A927CLD9_9BACL|nr:response regulator [Paenibacillus arenilitoris]MBD2868001.1 response regulator [Paenibacillus arenilitoris]